MHEDPRFPAEAACSSVPLEFPHTRSSNKNCSGACPCIQACSLWKGHYKFSLPVLLMIHLALNPNTHNLEGCPGHQWNGAAVCNRAEVPSSHTGLLLRNKTREQTVPLRLSARTKEHPSVSIFPPSCTPLHYHQLQGTQPHLLAGITEVTTACSYPTVAIERIFSSQWWWLTMVMKWEKCLRCLNRYHSFGSTPCETFHLARSACNTERRCEQGAERSSKVQV